jgi:hypothetical protein
MHFHVGAYAISPCLTKWDERQETAFVEGLKELRFVAGIELPHFATTFDRWDEDFFFRHADPAWSFVATALQSLSGALRDNPAIGLSAADDQARRVAIESIAAMRTSLRRVHDRLGRRAVRAVEIQSGSSGGRLNGTASAAHFADSLSEIGGWDWDGAELVVEHCDAALAGFPYQKGFLTLEEEIEGIAIANKRLDRPIGGSLNWGRSALEARSAEVVPRHTELLQSAGLLRGMSFSGCSGADTAFGSWKDAHMPPARTHLGAAFAEQSILIEAEMQRFFAQTQATNLAFIGLKIAIRPAEASVAERLALLHAGLLLMASAALAVHH